MLGGHHLNTSVDGMGEGWEVPEWTAWKRYVPTFGHQKYLDHHTVETIYGILAIYVTDARFKYHCLNRARSQGCMYVLQTITKLYQ